MIQLKFDCLILGVRGEHENTRAGSGGVGR